MTIIDYWNRIISLYIYVFEHIAISGFITIAVVIEASVFMHCTYCLIFKKRTPLDFKYAWFFIIFLVPFFGSLVYIVCILPTFFLPKRVFKNKIGNGRMFSIIFLPSVISAEVMIAAHNWLDVDIKFFSTTSIWALLGGLAILVILILLSMRYEYRNSLYYIQNDGTKLLADFNKIEDTMMISEIKTKTGYTQVYENSKGETIKIKCENFSISQFPAAFISSFLILLTLYTPWHQLCLQFLINI